MQVTRYRKSLAVLLATSLVGLLVTDALAPKPWRHDPTRRHLPPEEGRTSWSSWATTSGFPTSVATVTA